MKKHKITKKIKKISLKKEKKLYYLSNLKKFCEKSEKNGSKIEMQKVLKKRLKKDIFSENVGVFLGKKSFASGFLGNR